MRILKYIFSLLLLSVVAISILLLQSDFTVENKTIKSPRSSVYNYVNDYRNWADFGSWTTEARIKKVLYPGNYYW
jgi:hypothetical protein